MNKIMSLLVAASIICGSTILAECAPHKEQRPTCEQVACEAQDGTWHQNCSGEFICITTQEECEAQGGTWVEGCQGFVCEFPAEQ